MDCEKMCEIKRVGALRQRVDCEKMCEIKRVWALRGRQVVDSRGWIMKICAKLKRVGVLRGRWRVDCKKMWEIKRVRRRVECEKCAKLRS